MTVKKSNLSKSRKKVFDGSFEGAELPCVIIFAWFCIHLAVACETFSHNAVFSHGSYFFPEKESQVRSSSHNG